MTGSWDVKDCFDMWFWLIPHLQLQNSDIAGPEYQNQNNYWTLKRRNLDIYSVYINSSSHLLSLLPHLPPYYIAILNVLYDLSFRVLIETEPAGSLESENLSWSIENHVIYFIAPCNNWPCFALLPGDLPRDYAVRSLSKDMISLLIFRWEELPGFRMCSMN